MYLLKMRILSFNSSYMFTDKLGGSELPHPQNIKIEENPKLFAMYAIPENEIKLYKFLYISKCRKNNLQ